MQTHAHTPAGSPSSVVFTPHTKCHGNSTRLLLPTPQRSQGIRNQTSGSQWTPVGVSAERGRGHGHGCRNGSLQEGLSRAAPTLCLEMLHGHACSRVLLKVSPGPQRKHCALMNGVLMLHTVWTSIHCPGARVYGNKRFPLRRQRGNRVTKAGQRPYP